MYNSQTFFCRWRAAQQSQQGSQLVQRMQGSQAGMSMVAMRDSMRLFLQLEGAVEGVNGFEPEEVLTVSIDGVALRSCVQNTKHRYATQDCHVSQLKGGVEAFVHCTP